MPLSSLESPYRAFPSRGAVPALAGLLLPCGFAFDRPTARHGPRDSRPLSPARRPLRHGEHEARRTGRPGRRFPGVARRRPFACCHARRRRLVSDRPGSPDSAAGTPASKLCSPRESVPAMTACPGQGAVDRPLLSWASFPSKACSSSPRVRYARGRSSTGTSPISPHPREPSPGHAYSPGRAPAVGSRTHDPPASPGRSNPDSPPSGSDPARARFREAHARRSPAPPAFASETCYPRPLSAAPRASHVLRPRTARRGHAGGPRRRSFSVCWWAGLSRGRPSLVGFCPSSNRLACASGRRRAA
jgi:hypothetical protein